MSSQQLDLSQAIDLQAVMHKAAEEKAKQLPKPSGYRILCAIPEAEKEHESGLLKADEVKKQDPKNPLYKKYFMHGTSHFLGLDVHDIGSRYEPMQAGMVLTCEPGIYIPEEGIGIRIENDILITGKGPVDLMERIPIEVEEIEDLMNA